MLPRVSMWLLLGLLSGSAVAVGAERPAETVAFTRPPSARRVAGAVRIEFALNRPTDVAVYVLNAEGQAVRHLVAGVLGANAPAPLAANTLSQSIEWDGRDDLGEPAGGGPFKVRVAAGLAPRHAGYPLEKPGEPYVANGVVLGIGVAGDGGVYTITHRSLIREKGLYSIQRYTRDGAYAGTVMPFSSQVAPRFARGITPIVDEDGRPLMIYGSTNFALLDYMPANPLVQTCAVRANGNLLMLSIDEFTWERGATIGLTELRPAGGTPETPYLRLTFRGAERLWRGGSPAVVLSADEKCAYVVGLQQYRKLGNTPTLAALFRVAMDGDGALEPVFGEPTRPGRDEKHLSDPAGLAADGRGHLLVADRGNHRVVVLNEKDATWAGSFAVDNPLWVGVHRPSGAVYVYTHHESGEGRQRQASDELIRFSPWPTPKPAHRLKLPSEYYRGGRYVAAVDAHAQRPRIWLGQFFNTEAMKDPTPELLGFCDDLGDRFSEVRPVLGRAGRVLSWSITSDPTHRYVTLDRDGTTVLDDTTGEVLRPAGMRGTCTIGPDGLIYVMANSGNIRRYTTKGKEVPFDAVRPGAWVMGRDKDGRPVIVRELAKDDRLMGGVSYPTCRWSVTGQALPTYPSGTSGNERDFTLDRRGNIYVKSRGCTYHGSMIVDVFDKDGRHLRTAVWEIGDRAYGPRLDAAGNLYCILGVVGEDGSVPEVFKPVGAYHRLFASVVKFSPRGGALRRLSDADYTRDFGFAPPRTGLKHETVHVVTGRVIQAGKVLEGALWWRPGFSVYNVAQCHCNGHSFDVDPFGRVFYPDMLRFQIGVLDTNGNQIVRFGGYGNRDQRGPFSWTRDAESGALRPAETSEADDPAQSRAAAGLFAQPEFAFAFLNGLAVTDRHLYATDTLNQRLTRIRLTYAAEATCDVPEPR